MSRGRPAKTKNPTRRVVQADASIFAICQSLGWEYSDIFMEGYRVMLIRLLTARQAGQLPIGILPITKMDIVLEDLDEEIRMLQDTKEILEMVRTQQAKLVTFPKKDRERMIVFQELAEKYLTDNEIKEYHRIMAARIHRGEPGIAAVTSLLEDLEKRANGSGAIIMEIKKKDAIWKENMVWNFLIQKAGGES